MSRRRERLFRQAANNLIPISEFLKMFRKIAKILLPDSQRRGLIFFKLLFLFMNL